MRGDQGTTGTQVQNINMTYRDLTERELRKRSDFLITDDKTELSTEKCFK